MKEKISITLSRDVLSGIDRLVGTKNSRSGFIESVLRQYLQDRAKAKRIARDIEIINRYAEELNAQAEDVLEYQAADR